MDFFRIAEKVCNNELVTPAELEALDRWLCSQEGRLRFKDQLQQGLDGYRAEATIDMDDTLRKIHARRIVRRPAILRFFSPARSIAAAAVVVAVAAAAIYFAADRRQMEQPAYAQMVSPENTNMAVLTLSDGRTIIMDENAGDFEAESGAVVNVGQGELRYDNSTESSPEAMAEAKHDMYIPVGREYKLTLSDGTTVWLNSDTRLRYPIHFAPDQRRVELEGEAYFKVSEDRDRPFVIESAGQEITVLGTEFNVWAYANEAAVHTTLISGSVRVAAANGYQTVIEPGQQTRLDRATGNVSVHRVDAPGVTAWKDGFLVIEEQTLGQILNKLSRWYGTEYEIGEDISRERTFRGVIPKYSLEETLEKLELISKLSIRLEDNIIKVSE